MLQPDQIFVRSHAGPRIFAALSSAIVHGIVLILLLSAWRGPAIVPPEPSRATQVLSGRNDVRYRPRKTESLTPRLPFARQFPPKRRAPKAATASAGDHDSVEAIRERAKGHTAALLRNFKFRTTYGFIPNDVYSLAIQTEGSLPRISADDLPSRFEQYLVVEVTINIDGKVVEARVTAGMVDRKIQETVLSAIREFKYIPAKHNGTPIPSQVDIVVHVPS